MASVSVQKRLNILRWSEIEKWTSFSGMLRFGNLPSDWQMRFAHEFATQIYQKVTVESELKYKMAGVRGNGGGVFHRETVLGKEQSAKHLSPLKTNAFIYNRLFAWKKSFAVVPPDYEGFYVSNEFPQFEIDETIVLPEYLYLIFNSRKLIRAVNAASIGSSAVSRNRFKESDFLGFKVPIPPLPAQREILEFWKKTQEDIKEIGEIISKTKEDSFYKFRLELGISQSMMNRPKIFTAFWSDVDRWGNELVWRKTNHTNSISYPVSPLKKICKTGSGGTPSRKHKEYYDGDIPWVKTTEVKNGIIIDTEEKITEKAIASSSAKLYPAGSLIVAMYGQGATRGRTAKLGVDAATNQACLVITKIDESLDVDFLWYYLMISYEEMRALASGNNLNVKRNLH